MGCRNSKHAGIGWCLQWPSYEQPQGLNLRPQREQTSWSQALTTRPPPRWFGIPYFDRRPSDPLLWWTDFPYLFLVDKPHISSFDEWIHDTWNQPHLSARSTTPPHGTRLTPFSWSTWTLVSILFLWRVNHASLPIYLLNLNQPVDWLDGWTSLDKIKYWTKQKLGKILSTCRVDPWPGRLDKTR
jgi:hypothetical protein